MLRPNNYTTVLLTIIVIILVIGVGVALYYVLDLDWFSKQPVQIYNEVEPYDETPKVEIQVKKEIKYDITKRTYNIVLDTDELKIVVYKDGTVGITMLENEKYAKLANYTELLDKETKLSFTNIVRAYEVKVSKDSTPNSYIVLLDSNGNLYELVENEIIKNGKYAFVKVEGLAKIIDVRQITNDNLVENINGINAIAIDEESNELLLTDYLIKNNE